MTNDIHHVIEFVEREEYIEEDYPTPVESYNARTKLPIPERGDIVEFGWQEKDGERVDEIHMDDDLDPDVDTGYGRSERYEVIDIDHHYHHAKKRSGPMSLATNCIEINTTVIIAPHEDG